MWKRRKPCSTSEKPDQSKDDVEDQDDRKNVFGTFEQICGFKPGDLASFEKLTELLYRPTDPASLGVARALFGLCMVFDVVEERGLADVDIKWGDPFDCHFPLIHGMRQPPLPWMIVIYAIMWTGAFGMTLGLHFKTACACFVIPYWYIFLLDKSQWNNHTYLYGIVATIFWGTEANKYFAVDANKANNATATVPLWNYSILRFQFFALYFLAGLKKSCKEWLEGYAMSNLSKHWVFSPFTMFLTTEQTDFLVIHWFAFVFDLTVGFWMLFERTRIPAMVFCTAFHLMNSRLFSIGMFPYVCLATMPLFCNVDWPRKVASYFKCNASLIDKEKSEDKSSIETNPIEELLNSDQKKITACRTSEIGPGKSKIRRKQKFVVSLLLLHVVLQFFLPYSHFITKGYNNWVPGLYGYSWDMMVHAWDTILVVIRVHDNESNEDRYLDPKAWVQNDRWEKHGDMARQYAFCLKNNLIVQEDDTFNVDRPRMKKKRSRLSSNFSIYFDVWCSLNGRFQQRMFDPNVDLLAADWHPFEPVSFLMPLLTQYNSYRYKLEEIQEQVYNWSNDTNVLFVADFPGMHMNNYISSNFSNVTLTILEGEVTYSDEKQSSNVTVSKGSSIAIKTGRFHKIKTTSAYPACYMYTYTSRVKKQTEKERTIEPESPNVSFLIMKEINYTLDAWSRALGHIANAFFYIVYNVPMVRRVRLNKST